MFEHQGDVDLPVCWREIHRIGDQVLQGDVDGREVSVQQMRLFVALKRQFQASAQDPRRHLRKAFAYRGDEVCLLGFDRASARFQPGDGQQLIH